MKKAIMTVVMILAATAAFAETDNAKFSKYGIGICEELTVPATATQTEINQIMDDQEYIEVTLTNSKFFPNIVNIFKPIWDYARKSDSFIYYFRDAGAVAAYVQFRDSKILKYGCTTVHERNVQFLSDSSMKYELNINSSKPN